MIFEFINYAVFAFLAWYVGRLYVVPALRKLQDAELAEVARQASTRAQVAERDRLLTARESFMGDYQSTMHGRLMRWRDHEDALRAQRVTVHERIAVAIERRAERAARVACVRQEARQALEHAYQEAEDELLRYYADPHNAERYQKNIIKRLSHDLSF